MADHITMREDGSSEAMFHRLPAWHGKGTIVTDAPNSAEAIKLAQMDWTATKQPIFTLNNDGERVPIKSDMAVVRDDNSAILGVVGNKYTVIQNAEAFKFMDSLVDLGEIRYEACGTLKGGQQIWLLAKMPEIHYVTDDDPQESYILLTTGHDGYHTMKVFPTSVRVVCWNTLQFALQSRTTERFVQVRHSLNAMDKIETARKVLLGIKAQTDDVHHILDGLSKVVLTSAQVVEFMDKVFPIKKATGDEESTKTVNIRKQVMENFDSDPEQFTKAAKGTAFGLFNAVTKWVDWQRQSKDTDKQFASAWFGSGSVIKQNALVTLQKLHGINY